MGGPEEQIIAQMLHNMKTVGFFTLRNVEGFEEAELFRAVRAFYEIPEEEKRKLIWHNHCKENPNYYRGLTPFVDNDPAHKEMYDMGGAYHLMSEEER